VKLLEICRLRHTPVMTLINKLDRHGREPLDLLDEIEQVLQIRCAPVTWPLRSGRHFAGVYHIPERRIIAYEKGRDEPSITSINGMALDDPALDELLGGWMDTLREEISLIEEAGHDFDLEGFRAGAITPVFFGTALHNFGIRELLDYFVEIAPPPQPRLTDVGQINPENGEFSGFVFKIQANMDPQHRDRIAFVRVCSGKFEPGMRVRHVRLGRDMQMSNPVTFMARGRDRAGDVWPGDIVGVHNHGTIQIGDTFTAGEAMRFKGVPNFAPELFRSVRTADPLRGKALQKGLTQLCEEGAAQVFRLIDRNDVILGAVGALQFDVVAWRLKHEYGVDCVFDSVQIRAARWIEGRGNGEIERFKNQYGANVALDGGGRLTYLAPSAVNLQLVTEKWPGLDFHATREVSSG
jgi:peptide chain release factor 3